MQEIQNWYVRGRKNGQLKGLDNTNFSQTKHFYLFSFLHGVDGVSKRWSKMEYLKTLLYILQSLQLQDFKPLV